MWAILPVLLLVTWLLILNTDGPYSELIINSDHAPCSDMVFRQYEVSWTLFLFLRKKNYVN